MSLRDSLAAAIGAREAADGVAARDSEAVIRAAEMHRVATAGLAAFDGLDARIGQHRAAAIRTGATHILSADLANDRQARDAARQEVDELAAALAHLSTEHAASTAALSAAVAGVLDAAGAVMAEEAEGLALQAEAAEQAVRGLWDRLGGLLAACPVKVSQACRNRFEARPALPHALAIHRVRLPTGFTAEEAEEERTARAYLLRLTAQASAAA